MPLPNPSVRILQQGAFLNVIVYDEDDVRYVLGLVQNASYNEDFGVTPAIGIGHYGPLSIDPQNYTCSITIGTYIPLDPNKQVVEPYLDGGNLTMSQKMKTRADIALTGVGTVFPQMDFVDRTNGVVVNSFNHCVVASAGRNVSGNAHVVSNIQLLSIERII